MKKLIGTIVTQLPVTATPKAVYFLDKQDGTFVTYVSDDNGKLRKPADVGLVSVRAGSLVSVDNADPLNPQVSVELPAALQGITDEKVRAWDAKLASETQTSLRVKSQAANDSNTSYDVTLAYTGEDGVERDVVVNIPIPAAYQLPAHLQSITPEMIACWNEGCGDLGVWTETI